MNFDLYFSPFLISFLISVVITGALARLSPKFSWLESKRESKRHIHRKNISRLGGIALILSFTGAILLDGNLVISQSLWGVMLASFLILIVGLGDDFFRLAWRYQLFFHVIVAVLVFVFGARIEYITNPFGGILYLDFWSFFLPLIFGIFWIVMMINVVNWLDGIDGLSGGVSLAGTLTIFFLSLRPEVNQPPVGIITMALSGAILGFLIFNFHPSKIMAGTAGSWFMGFMLGVLAIFAGAKIATTLLVLAVPIVDFFWVIGERLKARQSIFSSDKRHLHYRLAELGWSQRKITLFFYILTVFVAFVALNTRDMGKLVAIIAAAMAIIFIFFYFRRKAKLKSSMNLLE